MHFVVTLLMLIPTATLAADAPEWDRLRACMADEMPDIAAAHLSTDDGAKALRFICRSEIAAMERAMVERLRHDRRVRADQLANLPSAVHRSLDRTVTAFAGQVQRRHSLGDLPMGR